MLIIFDNGEATVDAVRQTHVPCTDLKREKMRFTSRERHTKTQLSRRNMDLVSFKNTLDSTPLFYFIAAVVIVGAWVYLVRIPQRKNRRYPLAGNQLPIGHLLRKPARRKL
jgi:hypothetical protein